jgi:hypothetical protein
MMLLQVDTCPVQYADGVLDKKGTLRGVFMNASKGACGPEKMIESE